VSDHELTRDDLAAYSLGALEPAEKIAAERHLASCETCAEYLRWLGPAVDLLPSSVEQQTPPARLKRSLMDAVAEDLKAERRAERTRARRERGLWGTIWRPVTAGVLALSLVAGGALGYFMRGDDQPESVFVAAKPEAKVGGAMEATLEVQGDQGVLHVERLPGLPADADYQAWIQRDGVMEPSSTFDVREDGEVGLEGSLEGASGVYITREPEGGSEEPTSAPLMSAKIS
jgi:hypothetical protein